MRRESILQCISQDKKALKQYDIKSLSLFGSVAREEGKETSDVDLLVAFNHPPGLFAFMDLKEHLEEILGAHVDLVTEKALHPRLRNRILKESIHVF